MIIRNKFEKKCHTDRSLLSIRYNKSVHFCFIFPRIILLQCSFELSLWHSELTGNRLFNEQLLFFFFNVLLKFVHLKYKNSRWIYCCNMNVKKWYSNDGGDNTLRTRVKRKEVMYAHSGRTVARWNVENETKVLLWLTITMEDEDERWSEGSDFYESRSRQSFYIFITNLRSCDYCASNQPKVKKKLNSSARMRSDCMRVK